MVSPCHSFSFLFLFRLIPWSSGALCIHFPAWASKTHSRRCLRWAPSAIWEGACGLREQSKSCAGALLAFCVNQGISASFLSSIFLTAKFFPYLFLYFSQLPTPSSWGNPWIQPGLDPGKWCPNQAPSKKEIKYRDNKYFVGHIRAHSGLPGPLHEGNALADALTKVRKISWTQEPGGLQSMGLPRVGHDWATNTYLLT